MTFAPSHTNHAHLLEDIEVILTALFVLELSTFATCTFSLAIPDYETYTACA